MRKIINLNEFDSSKQPIFFGESLNIQRYDKFKYENLVMFAKFEHI